MSIIVFSAVIYSLACLAGFVQSSHPYIIVPLGVAIMFVLPYITMVKLQNRYNSPTLAMASASALSLGGSTALLAACIALNFLH